MRTPLALLAALLAAQSAPEESEPEQPGAAPVLEAFDLGELEVLVCFSKAAPGASAVKEGRR